MFFTYAPGMREKYSVACATNLQSSPTYYPGADKLQVTMTGGVLAARNETFYEACYYIFKIDSEAWKSGSMQLWIDDAQNANYYVFKGFDRLTATLATAVDDPASGKSYFTGSFGDTLMLVTQNKASAQ